MCRTVFLLLLMASLACPRLWSEETPPAPTGPAQASKPTALPDLKPLIAKLGSDDVQVREEATRELVKIGRSAYPEFKKAAESETDLETKTRLKEVLAACSIRLGVILPFTDGPGTYWQAAIKMAFEDETKESSEGPPIEPIFEDDKSYYRIWSEKAQKLVEKQGCVALFGSIPMRDYEETARLVDSPCVPVLSPLVLEHSSEIPSKWIVRLNPNVYDQGVILANFAADHLKAKTAAIVFHEFVQGTVGDVFAKGFTDTWTAHGLTFTKSVIHAGSRAQEETALAAKMKPDLLVIANNASPLALMQLGKGTWQGIPRLALKEIGEDSGLDVAKDFLGETYFSQYVYCGQDRNELHALDEKCRKRTGEDLAFDFVLAYDSARLAIRTLRAANDYTPEALLKTFKNAQPINQDGRCLAVARDGNFRGKGDVLRTKPDKKHELKGQWSYTLPKKINSMAPNK